jgi:dUTPase
MKIKIINTSGYPNPSYATEGDSGMDIRTCISEPVNIEPGDRIAQLVLAKVSRVDEFENIEFFEEETERGDGGYGNTGVQ